MRGKGLSRLIALLPVALLAAMPALAQQQTTQQSQTGDSLADAARKAREAKKTAPKAKKVFTDDDIASRAPAPTAQQAPAGEKEAAPTGAAPAGTQAAAAKGAAAPKEDPNSESAWRKRFAQQREKISKAEQELDVLQREMQKTEVQYYPDPQKAMEQQYSRKDVNEKQAKIDAKKKEIEQLKQQLSDMEDALKKAGGDPGWARE
jgi:chromosome segregation ATPase